MTEIENGELKKAVIKPTPAMMMAASDRKWISRHTLSLKLGVTLRTVDRYVERGILPQPVRFASNCVRFDEQECMDAINSCINDKIDHSKRG